MRALGCGRRAPRKSVDLRCSAAFRRGTGRRFRITEMSSLGAWLRTSKPLAPGERFELQLPLPGGAAERLTVKAEVMWSRTRRSGRGAGMGVEFVNLGKQDQQQLHEALDTCPEAAGGAPRFLFNDADS